MHQALFNYYKDIVSKSEVLESFKSSIEYICFINEERGKRTLHYALLIAGMPVHYSEKLNPDSEKKQRSDAYKVRSYVSNHLSKIMYMTGDILVNEAFRELHDGEDGVLTKREWVDDVGRVARQEAVKRVKLKTGKQPRIDSTYRSYLLYKYRELQKEYADVKRYHKREHDKYLKSKNRTSRSEWKRVWADGHVSKYPDLSPEIIQLFADEPSPSPSEAAQRELRKKSRYSIQTLDRYVLRRKATKRN